MEGFTASRSGRSAAHTGRFPHRAGSSMIPTEMALRRVLAGARAAVAIAALLVGCGDQTSASAPCELPRYPVRNGATWQYQVSFDPPGPPVTRAETAADVRTGE